MIKYNKNLLKIVLTDIESDNNNAFSDLSSAFLANSKYFNKKVKEKKG